MVCHLHRDVPTMRNTLSLSFSLLLAMGCADDSAPACHVADDCADGYVCNAGSCVEQTFAETCVALCDKADACGYLDSEDAETCAELCEYDLEKASDYEPCFDAVSELEACAPDVACETLTDGSACAAEILAYRKRCFERSVWGANDLPVVQSAASEAACCRSDDICGWADDIACQCETQLWDERDCAL